MRSSTRKIPMLAVLCLLGFGMAATTQAAIYRTVDEEGNVVFTDVPPRPGEPGQAVDIKQPNSFEPSASGNRISLEDWARGQGDEDDERNPGEVRYSALRITSPANDEALRDNAGNVTVRAHLEPDLATGHALQLYLDGTLSQTGPDTTFQLSNVDRGTHSVELRVVDGSGATLINSQPAVFHLQRRSVILQPPRPRTN